MLSIPGADDAKGMARRLRQALSARHHVELKHADCLEAVASMFGARDWNTFIAIASAAPVDSSDYTVPTTVPVLRIFDWDVAQRFYLDYLGWQLERLDQDGDHRPVYARLSGPPAAFVDLSEHHDDGTPGSVVLLPVRDFGELVTRLTADRSHPAPSVGEHFDVRSLTVYDPFGNRLVFLDGRVPSVRVPDELQPIVTEVQVPVDPSAAFAAFTELDWWRDYGRDDAAPVVIRQGEVIFENRDGDLSIGTITAWQPEHRYAQTFTLAQDPDHPTTLDVAFRRTGRTTTVRLEHGGWNAANAVHRSRFTDWPRILGYYVSSIDDLYDAPATGTPVRSEEE